MSVVSLVPPAHLALFGRATSPSPRVAKAKGRGSHIDPKAKGRGSYIDPAVKPWGRQFRFDAQRKLAAEREVYVHKRMALPPSQRCDKPVAELPRPRVYVYELPPHLLPPPTSWRHVFALKVWVEGSRFYETNPFCADYFLVPSHPSNRELRIDQPGHDDVGDLRMARAFGYIRDRFPFWNRTVRASVARHMLLLPCDHGPGDCAYTRPSVPYKYAPWAADPKDARRWWPKKSHAFGASEIESSWGESWEFLNPASPARLVIFLLFNGWSDGLRSPDGGCLNCFAPGLDIRLPTPETHECGVSCGLHYMFNATSKGSWFIPPELQRVLLRRAVSRSAAVYPQRGIRRPPSDGCLFSWAGSVRGRNSPARFEVLRLAGKEGACVANTAAPKNATKDRPFHDKPMPSIPHSMLRSRFCFSPRGWDQGDSDRYLPALLYGCIPVMSDRLEAMPLDELPEMVWNATAFALERDRVASALELLRTVDGEEEALMRNRTLAMVPRMLYSSFEFSNLPSRTVGCVGCAPHRTDCSSAKIGVTPSTLIRKLAPLAAALHIDLQREPVCGRTSYFGEDGSRDAFEGLMEVLRLRMHAPHAPVEPWVRAGAEKAEKSWPLTRKWFERRAAWYWKLAAESEPVYTLLRGLPPAYAYRRALGRTMGIIAPEKKSGRLGILAKRSKARGSLMSLLRGATLLALSWAAEATSEGGNCSATCVDLAAVPDFATCTDACVGDESWVRNIPAVLFAVVLVLFSGMFSGLTLGLLSLSIEGLEIVINGGSADEAKWAETILPLRRRGNLLLCTLLLGNTLVNAVIAILLADLTSGLAGGLLSTAVIVIFGEILPQAVCSRYGLRIGAAATCIVKLLMYLFSPVTMPIAFVLDLLLGREMSRSFNRLQLDKLLEMHLTDQAITTDDQMLLSSALHFSSKVVEEIMTPLKDVFAISVTDNLDFDDLKAIYVSGYTRIPVYHNRRDTIVGIVYTKDLILVDPNDEIPVASVIPFCSRAINAAPKGTTLEKLLADMQASRSHLYFVTDTVGVCRKKLPRVEHVIGIVTMEDLIEELISIEIIDESDTVTDNISKKRVNTRGLGQRRIEFFEMLQKRELLLTERILSDNSRIGGERPTADEVRAITSYLSNNVANFRPPHMSLPLLRRLLLRCSITSVSPEQVATGRYVYVRGVPASFCCLVLHGRLQIRAGNEGFTTEIGAWTTLATQALTDVEYTPDFTARVEVAARILIISRAEVHAVLGITGSPAPYSRPLQVDATHPGGAAVESMYGLRVDVSPTMQPAAVPQSIASAPLTAAPRRNSNATQGETIYGGGQKSPGSRTSGQLSHEQGRRDKRERGSHE